MIDTLRETTRTLPEGWRWAKLGEVCEERTGIRDPAATPDDTFYYVDISSVENSAKRIVEPKTLMGKDAPSRARQVIRTDDVIVSTTRPNLNAVAIIPPELENEICSTGFCVLRAKKDLDSRYLFAFVQSSAFVRNLSDLVKGALYPAVTDSQVREQLIPLPPLPEQRRIAALLAEQMAAVERARAAAEARLEAARALPAALLRQVFESEEARSWHKIRLGTISNAKDFLADGPFGSNLKTNHYTTSGVRVVRLQNIGLGAFLDNDKAYISLDHFATLQRHTALPGDVVIAALGDGARPAGRACVVPENIGAAIVKADCFRVRPPSEKLLAPYLVAYLNSPLALQRMSELMRGATRPRVTLDILRTIEIPVPPIREQQRYIHTIEDRMSASKRSWSALIDQLDAINALPAALLRRAFAGEV